ncbi:hypothetical protein Ndes2437B_g03716 [Nannochloris sp. 'desiccata']
MSGADNAGHATKVPAQPHSGSERGVQQPRNWYFASILRFFFLIPGINTCTRGAVREDRMSGSYFQMEENCIFCESSS